VAVARFAYCGGERLKADDVAGINDVRVREHVDRLYAHHDDVVMPALMSLSYVKY
jgi:hypothetical protein